jgi:hypothetical protein
MEIVLGILLLFGAFTLGAVSSDTTDHETHTTHMQSDGATLQAQTVAASSMQKCQQGGSVRNYRDLTVPIAKPAVQQPKSTDDDENFGWDE